MKFRGKTAIVTGGGRDIGRACAIRLAAEGANVAINYFQSSDQATETVEAIKNLGGNAFALYGDLCKKSDALALVATAHETFGSIDILINNTGGLIARKRMSEMTIEHWLKVMDLNVTSAVSMIQACLPLLSSGTIVNIASQAGRDGGGPGATAYGASKGALITLTRGLAKELGPDIRVNSVCPGMINTDFHNKFTHDDVRRNVANATPLKREGEPEDVANLVAYLCSEEASFITGANFDINGGILFS